MSATARPQPAHGGARAHEKKNSPANCGTITPADRLAIRAARRVRARRELQIARRKATLALQAEIRALEGRASRLHEKAQKLKTILSKSQSDPLRSLTPRDPRQAARFQPPGLGGVSFCSGCQSVEP